MENELYNKILIAANNCLQKRIELREKNTWVKIEDGDSILVRINSLKTMYIEKGVYEHLENIDKSGCIRMMIRKGENGIWTLKAVFNFRNIEGHIEIFDDMTQELFEQERDLYYIL